MLSVQLADHPMGPGRDDEDEDEDEEMVGDTSNPHVERLRKGIPQWLDQLRGDKIKQSQATCFACKILGRANKSKGLHALLQHTQSKAREAGNDLQRVCHKVQLQALEGIAGTQAQAAAGPSRIAPSRGPVQSLNIARAHEMTWPPKVLVVNISRVRSPSARVWEVPGGNPSLTAALQAYKWGQKNTTSKVLFDRTGSALGYAEGPDSLSTRGAGFCAFEATREGKEGVTALDSEMMRLSRGREGWLTNFSQYVRRPGNDHQADPLFAWWMSLDDVMTLAPVCPTAGDWLRQKLFKSLADISREVEFKVATEKRAQEERFEEERQKRQKMDIELKAKANMVSQLEQQNRQQQTKMQEIEAERTKLQEQANELKGQMVHIEQQYTQQLRQTLEAQQQQYEQQIANQERQHRQQLQQVYSRPAPTVQQPDVRRLSFLHKSLIDQKLQEEREKLHQEHKQKILEAQRTLEENTALQQQKLRKDYEDEMRRLQADMDGKLKQQVADAERKLSQNMITHQQEQEILAKLKNCGINVSSLEQMADAAECEICCEPFEEFEEIQEPTHRITAEKRKQLLQELKEQEKKRRYRMIMKPCGHATICQPCMRQWLSRKTKRIDPAKGTLHDPKYYVYQGCHKCRADVYDFQVFPKVFM